MLDAGKPVVPIILKRLKTSGVSPHYFPILRYITGENPLPAPPLTDKYGKPIGSFVRIDVRSTENAWIKWGEKEGLI